MTGPDLPGRYDEDVPVVSWQLRSGAQLVALALATIVLWHAAVVLTVDTISWADWPLTIRALVRGHPMVLPGHRTGSGLTVPLWIVLIIVMVVGWLGWVRHRIRRRSRTRPWKGFASAAEATHELGLRQRAEEGARVTRPSLNAAAVRAASPHDLGWLVGHTTPEVAPVWLSLEDSAAVIGPSGSGKTADFLVAAAATAPGPLMVTSTRPDILDPIAVERSRRGRVWVFDPLRRFGWPEPMVWDPVAGCQEGERALALGSAFVAGLGVDDSVRNGAFFQKAAASALTRLLHAAALDERTVEDVLGWAIHLDNGAEIPQDIIRQSTDPRREKMWPGLLRSVATGAEETVSSTRQTLQQAIEPMALRAVMACVTPHPGVPTFDPAAFVRSNDTLVLLSDSTAEVNVAPLTTMLFQAVVDAAKAEAANRPSARLDPPLRIVADEVANVAPLPKLPDLSADARGHGIQLIIGLQSLTQAVSRWGDDAARTLLTNASAEIVLGGLTDVPTLERYATLAGDVEVQEAVMFLEHHGVSTGSHLQHREKPAMRADEIRRIPRHQALLIYRSFRPAMIRSSSWWEGSQAADLLASQEWSRDRRRGVPGPSFVGGPSALPLSTGPVEAR